MNWIFGKSKSNLPEPTALQTQRAKQIEQLKTFNQNVTELQRDVEYRVSCMVGSSNIFLHITLPPRFPQDKPIVKVSPPLQHPWLNDQMQVVGSPAINNFMVQSDLGKAVREIIEEFQRHPPTSSMSGPQPYSGVPYPISPAGVPVAGQIPASLPNYPAYRPPPSAATSYMPPRMPMPTLPPVSSTAQLPYPQSMPPSQSQGAFGERTSISSAVSYKMPDLPTSFPMIHDYSTQQLQQLADDEGQILQVLSNLPQVKKIAEDRQRMCEGNEEMARDNLSKKPLLEERKRVLLEQYDALNDVRTKFDENSQNQDKLRAQFDPRAIQENLKVAALQAEEESEQIAEKFLEGKLSVEEFTKKYIAKRTVCHSRKSKEERLAAGFM